MPQRNLRHSLCGSQPQIVKPITSMQRRGEGSIYMQAKKVILAYSNEKQLRLPKAMKKGCVCKENKISYMEKRRGEFI